MAGFFTRGIILEQHKEPALSREPRKFFNANTQNNSFDNAGFPPPEQLTAEQIIEIARLANIVDERDGVLLYKKLAAGKVETVVGDASDDEPYISSQINPLLKKESLTLQGLSLVKTAVGAKQSYFAVYKNITDISVKIPNKIGGVTVKRIRGRYPAEYRITDEFKHCGSILMVGVCALIHLARAAAHGKVQTSCFLTVAGNCIANPTNLEVSLGMPIMQVLERCGLSKEPNAVVLGGPMTGISCNNPENTVVTHTTRAILAFKEDNRERHYKCIGCGRCVEACPENLTPFYINKCIEHGRFSELPFYEIDRCIGCGTCSYVCPAKLDISANIKEARANAFKP
ncbi:MAG: 4Fe-4S binding protein [Hydrogenoanaerobacterium sp.]